MLTVLDLQAATQRYPDQGGNEDDPVWLDVDEELPHQADWAAPAQILNGPKLRLIIGLNEPLTYGKEIEQP